MKLITYKSIIFNGERNILHIGNAPAREFPVGFFQGPKDEEISFFHIRLKTVKPYYFIIGKYPFDNIRAIISYVFAVDATFAMGHDTAAQPIAMGNTEKTVIISS